VPIPAFDFSFRSDGRLAVLRAFQADLVYADETWPATITGRTATTENRGDLWMPRLARSSDELFSTTLARPEILRYSLDLRHSEVVWSAREGETIHLYAVSDDSPLLVVEVITTESRVADPDVMQPIVVVNLKIGKEITRHLCRPAYAIVTSPDGSVYGYIHIDGVTLVDSTTGSTLHTLGGPNSAINYLAFSPDGREVATVSDDRSLRIWRISDGVEIHSVEAHKIADKNVACTPDARRSGRLDAIVCFAAGGVM